MKKRTRKSLVVSLAILFTLMVVGIAMAADRHSEEQKQQLKETPEEKPVVSSPAKGYKVKIANPKMPVYRPPKRGAPGSRVAGGTRGPEDQMPVLYALVPDHVGLTIQEQPSLYWFLSKLPKAPIELTVIEDQAVHPLFESRIAMPEEPGIQLFDLKKYGVHLKVGKVYKWFVAIVPDPQQRSKDVLAGGEIERTEVSEALRIRIEQADQNSVPFLYAEQGLWYDALASISKLVEAAPQDKVRRKQRASLLQQVGLVEVAQYDLTGKLPKPN